MIHENKKTFLGKGWSFPPAFNKNEKSGRVHLEMVEAEKDIRQSLYIILSTLPGERLMNQRFGCDLMSQVFEDINSNTLVRIESMIADAILFYEPRVDLNSVRVDGSQAPDGYLNIEIHYTIRSINSRSNMVFPFYFNEGTLITEM